MVKRLLAVIGICCASSVQAYIPAGTTMKAVVGSEVKITDQKQSPIVLLVQDKNITGKCLLLGRAGVDVDNQRVHIFSNAMHCDYQDGRAPETIEMEAVVFSETGELGIPTILARESDSLLTSSYPGLGQGNTDKFSAVVSAGQKVTVAVQKGG